MNHKHIRDIIVLAWLTTTAICAFAIARTQRQQLAEMKKQQLARTVTTELEYCKGRILEYEHNWRAMYMLANDKLLDAKDSLAKARNIGR